MAFQKWGTHTFSVKPFTRTYATAPRQTQQQGADLSGLLAGFQKSADEARAANLARYQEAMGIYKDIESMYAPGGTFGKGYEAMLGRAKTKSVAGGMQRLTSAGLAGTTRVGGLERQFEEEVGMPQRAKLEDIRMGRLAQARGARAGFIERREDEYPDYGMVAQLMAQAGQTKQAPERQLSVAEIRRQQWLRA